MKNANQAVTILSNMPTNQSLEYSKDGFLAVAFVVKADALSLLVINSEAVDSYVVAEKLYDNLYQGNVNKIDEVSLFVISRCKGCFSGF